MAIHRVVWDMDDDPEGNVQHIGEHDLTKEDVEEVLYGIHELVFRFVSPPEVFSGRRYVGPLTETQVSAGAAVPAAAKRLLQNCTGAYETGY